MLQPQFMECGGKQIGFPWSYEGQTPDDAHFQTPTVWPKVR
jgi:hypothetical protein